MGKRENGEMRFSFTHCVFLLYPHLVGQDVDSLLQVAVFRVQQRRLFALEGAVGVGVVPKLADHRELRR